MPDNSHVARTIAFERSATNALREDSPEIISVWPQRDAGQSSSIRIPHYGKNIEQAPDGPRGRNSSGQFEPARREKEMVPYNLEQASWYDSINFEDDFESAVDERGQMMREMVLDVRQQQIKHIFNQLSARNASETNWTIANDAADVSDFVREPLNAIQRFAGGMIAPMGFITPAVHTLWKTFDETLVSIDNNMEKPLGMGYTQKSFNYWGVNWMVTSLLPGANTANTKGFVVIPQSCVFVNGYERTDVKEDGNAQQMWHVSMQKRFTFGVQDPLGVAVINFSDNLAKSTTA